jgi:hypothetical protein
MAEEEVQEPREDKSLLKPLANAGADYGKYNWGQILGSVDVFIPMRSGIKSRDVDVKITASSLKVGLRGEDPIIDGALHDKVKADDCTWTLVDNKLVHVCRILSYFCIVLI